MKRSTMLRAAAFALTIVLGAAVSAQNPCVTPTKHKASKKKVEPCGSAEKQLADLQAQLKAQQAQIDALSAQLSASKPAAPETDPIATPIANQAAADAADAKAKANGVSSSIADLKSTVEGEQTTILDVQKKIGDLESPTAIHYKGVLIQPGGFAAAESVFRTRAVNSDIATPLNSIPYGNSTNAHLSEFNGSGRQSRISLLVNAPFSWGKAGGYFEGDFLGAGTTSNNNQTNSYVFRVRSAFGQVLLNNGFSFQAGQMFTLATEVKKGILAGPGAEALPPTVDPNYNVGFNFGRQYAVRFAQSLLGGKANAAVSLEESQIVFTGSNAPANFVFGGAGSSGGLFNSTGGSSGGGSAAGAAAAVQNYTDNLAPDMHVKVTADPGLGHYEIGGIVRLFRDRKYQQTCVSACGTSAAVLTTSNLGTNVTAAGGGVYASARVPATKFADVGLKGYFGRGLGRYAAANLGDVTADAFGNLVPLRTVGGLFELDFHPTKKLDIFFLDGAEYLQRTTYLSPYTGQQVGYAGMTTQNNTNCNLQSPPANNSGNGYSVTANCAGATRYIYESTGGITYRFFNSPTKGRFQMQLVYSYIDKQSWQGYLGPSYAYAVANGSQYFHGAQAVDNMVTTGFRYYIP